MKTAEPHPVLITWAQVMSLCRRASVGEHTAKKIFRRDCPARKLLPHSSQARYVRREVLKELGLSPDSDEQS